MATVTIAKSYFEALLRRAEFHTSAHELCSASNSPHNVSIPKAEHNYLLQANSEYNLLKSALFRGGLTVETLETLLAGERGVTDEPSMNNGNSSAGTSSRPQSVPVKFTTPDEDTLSPHTDDTAVGDERHAGAQSHSYNRVYSYGPPDSSIESPSKDGEDYQESSLRLPTHDQRTVLVTNLSDRTTHKDLVSLIRGGRLLDIFLRNDRCATISFVEGAAEFLAYAKRNDIYLHMKRLEFRWNDRQFHVPPHVSNKIAAGATRNLVVRGVAGKLTAGQIRDHLDHIHNLVVVDIIFNNGDAYISTNSIHNALFARTCMMSRTAYKGLRIEWCPDECAAPLPRPKVFTPSPAPPSVKPLVPSNPYTLLDTGSESDSDSDETPYFDGVKVANNNWVNTAVA